MTLVFDIAQEELPIFQAECNEQLQILDEGLVRLESEGSPEFIQALFRAAHTLKGSSGMIGHKRMVDLTHALENALDGLRKGQIHASAMLLDACLETTDALRLLCGEVETGEPSHVDIPPLVDRLTEFLRVASPQPQPAKKSAEELQAGLPEGKDDKQTRSGQPIDVYAVIARDSIASAARAFQIMLALQENGDILKMDPTLEQIETAAAVRQFSAQFLPCKPLDVLRKALSLISEVEWFSLGEEVIGLKQAPVSQPDPQEERPSGPKPLGEILVSQGVITEGQLKSAMDRQANERGPAAVLGQTLVKMGFISQEILDEAVAEQNRQKKAVGRQAEPSTQEKNILKTSEKTIRASVERLDTLMNLVGELITDRNRLFLIRSELEGRQHGNTEVEALAETITHVGRITDQLQAEVMGIRMLPISNVFNKFPRLVRDLARNAGKQIELVIRGEDTELDRSVIEEVTDPLIHMLRNSVDHGIELPEERIASGKPERGTILLTARHEQGRIILTIEDDGKGIDIERVKAKAIEKGILSKADAAILSEEAATDLIFVSGLSTARVVSEVSGRGVGMDIVRSNIEHVNGSIQIETWPGRGTQFQIIMPLTLAIVPTLLVNVGRVVYAIPLVAVTETLRTVTKDIQTANGRPVILLRDQVLPLVKLADVFHLKRKNHYAQEKSRYEYIVVVHSGKSQIGLIVDKLVGEQEVVVKSLSAILGEVPGLSSAAILGDGQVALIVDVQELIKLVLQQHTTRASYQMAGAAQTLSV